MIKLKLWLVVMGWLHDETSALTTGSRWQHTENLQWCMIQYSVFPFPKHCWWPLCALWTDRLRLGCSYLMHFRGCNWSKICDDASWFLSRFLTIWFSNVWFCKEFAIGDVTLILCALFGDDDRAILSRWSSAITDLISQISDCASPTFIVKSYLAFGHLTSYANDGAPQNQLRTAPATEVAFL